MRTRAILAFVLLLAVGCGKRETPPARSASPAPAAAPARPAAAVVPPAHAARTNAPPTATQVAPAAGTPVSAAAPQSRHVEPPPSSTPAPPPAPAGTDAAPADAFAAQLAEVLALEADAEFPQAQALCAKVKTAFPSHPRAKELNDIALRLKEERAAAGEVPYALKNLASADRATVKVAKDKLTDAGETGLIYLRRAVRKGPPAEAAPAAALLGELRDSAALPVLIARFEQERHSPFTVAAATALEHMVDRLSTNHIVRCYRTVAQDTGIEKREMVRLLYTFYRIVCKEDAQAFDRTVGAPGAYAGLRGYVERCLVSSEESAVVLAVEDGREMLAFQDGLAATYFSDTGFTTPVLRRAERAVYWPESRQFPMPGGQQDNFSARWTGLLKVDQPGDYRIFALADDWARVYIDDCEAVFAQFIEQAGAVKLPKGTVRIRVEYAQGGADARLVIAWEGPGIPKTHLLPYRIKPEREEVLAMNTAVRNLASTNWPAVRAARTALTDAGEVGRIFLRDAVRTKPPELAVPALEMLVAVQDERTAPLALERLRAGGLPPAAVAHMTRGLRDLGGVLSTNLCRTLYADLAGSPPGMPAEAAALCGAFDLRCGGDRDRFNAFAGAADACDRLSARVLAAAVSTNRLDADRACEYGPPIVPRLIGLRGRYFEGERFDRLVLDRLDETVAVGERQFPMPGGRQDVISAQWTGWLSIGAPGDYQFWLRAENLGNVWIDGRLVLSSNFRGNDAGVTLKLTAGLHPFRAEFQQWQGVSTIVFNWAPPGQPRQNVPREAFRTLAWPGALADVRSAAAALASPDLAALAQAKATLRGHWPPAQFALRDALRAEADPGRMGAILGMLAELRDSETPAVLIERVRRAPALALNADVVAGMADLAPFAAPADLAWMLEQVRADTVGRMDASAAALCSALEKSCAGEKAKFNALLKSDTAYDALQACVDRAAQSADTNALARVCSYGAPFVPYANGLRGRYYDGANFERLVLDRIDAAASMENQRFPHPKNRQDNVSARWDGWFRVDAPGDYGFAIWTRQYGDLWIDEKPALVARGNEGQGAVKLSAGMHRLRMEFRSGPSENAVGLDWWGPNLQRQRLSAAWARTAIPPADARALTAALGALGGAGAPQGAAVLHAREPVSRVLLRGAVRNAPEPAAAAAMGLLVYREDAAALPALLARLKAEPGLALRPVGLDGMANLAHRLAPADLAAVRDAWRAEPDAKMSAYAAALCAALDRTCFGQEAKFGALLQDPKAYADLREYVRKAAESADLDTVLRACAYGSAFTGRWPGLRARYYEGREPEKQVLERTDTQVAMENRRFPHPTDPGRQERVSAVWTGLLLAPAAGDYNFRLYGRETASLWIDGELILSALQQEAAKPLKLAQGQHAVRVDYRHGGGDSGINLDWEGPGFGRVRIDWRWLCTSPWPAELAQMAAQVKALAGPDQNQAVAAAARLAAAGEPGTVLLRHALREGSDALAAHAARILVLAHDPEAPRTIAARLRKQPASPVAGALFDALRGLAPLIPAADCAWLYAQAPRDGAPAGRPALAVLLAVLEQQCGGGKEAFNTLAGDPGAYDALKAMVGAMLAGADKEAMAWALEFGGPFSPTIKGARGRYFEGMTLEKVVADRRDGGVGFPNNQFPHPQGRQESVSAWWSGLLSAPASGDYQFSLRADDGARLWVDGRLVTDAWLYSTAQERVGAAKLTQGNHLVEVAWYQSQGERWVESLWQGPGLNRTPIAAPQFRVHAWPVVLDALNARIARLGSNNPGEVQQAKEAIRDCEDVTKLLLRNAIRDGKGGVPAGAAAFLGELGDATAWPALADRLAVEPDPGLTPAAVNLLVNAPDRLSREQLTALHRLLDKDAAFARRDLVRLFEVVFQKVCGSDKTKFNQLTGPSDQFGMVKLYLQKAGASSDGNIANWAKSLLQRDPWK